MKLFAAAFLLLLLFATSLSAHDLSKGYLDEDHDHDHDHGHKHGQANPAGPWKREQPPQVVSAASTLPLAAAAAAITNAANAPTTAKPFLPFPRLDLRSDGDFLYVGSNGLPDHNMMVGITAWQQQVPLPQNYFGDNMWRIPLKPVPAKDPAMIKGRFLRGAIALAVNGIPIFNPQNNRGEISYEIGELDQWGGHCGRADDYHYHMTPLHLQAQAGKGMPVAYALDGYPIYGLTEPDGSMVGKLDACSGHELPGIGYHYHATMRYPYVIGGFHGEVVERQEQVDPQPRAQGVREALPALRGARITGFESPAKDSYKLSYELNGDKRSVSYTIKADGTYAFTYDNGSQGKTQQVYTARQGGGGGGGPPRGQGGGRPRRPGDERRQGPLDEDNPPPRPQASVEQTEQTRSSDGKFLLTSPVMEDLKEMPIEYTGDGEGATLPLVWKGAPAGTRGYALIMDHADKDGAMKWYWTLYDLPANATSLPKNARGIGKVGTGFRGMIGYEPPHSKGPGAKTYVITLYALSAALDVAGKAPGREELLAAMRGKVLASSSLRVIHTSKGVSGAPRQ